jgi:fimbrial chaperone protein
MRTKVMTLATAFSIVTAIAPVSAASLQVTPVSLEIPAPGAATTLTLKNPGTTPLKAQLRVYRWSIINGEEKLDLANDVVASPPMATLQPNTDYTVRIVRLSKTPAAIEETYRLVVDEIPQALPQGRTAINLAFRYSIPVFFTPQNGGSPDLKWSTERRAGKLYVSVTNSGSRRVRVSDLHVADASGKSNVLAKGLAGYVLARSSMSWVAPVALQSVAKPLLITALGDSGPINAQALPQPSR